MSDTQSQYYYTAGFMIYYTKILPLEGAMDDTQEQVSNWVNKKFCTSGGEATFGVYEGGKVAETSQQCDCSASYSTKQPGLSALEKHTDYESWTPNSKVWMSGELLRSTVVEFYQCTVDRVMGTQYCHTTGYMLMALMTYLLNPGIEV